MTNYICPYCLNNRTNKVKFTSWKGVAAHTNNCVKYTGEYIINLNLGPIHYTYFLNKNAEALKLEFGISKYRDMLDRFRVKGFIKPDNTKKYTKEDCIKAIKQKASTLGRNPVSGDFRKTEGKYPCIQYITEMFGSWNAALLESGFELNHKSELYGVPTLSKDGHTYRSKAEATFADRYLYKQYDYIIEPQYPEGYHKWYDWYIPSLDLYIELDGGIRPEAISQKIEINTLLNRKCLIIPTYIIKSPYKNNLTDFMDYKI